MKESESDKYLGDYLHCRGNDQSIITTVKKRYGKAIEAVLDIKNIVEDVRAVPVGGIETGLEIFELSVIPFLLFNCEIWDHIPSEAMKHMERVHLTFLRNLLKTPISTPIPSLYWETGSVDMISKINQRKLTFYHHVMNLEERSLAKVIAKIQLKNKYPGLMLECEELLKEYNLYDKEPESYSKFSWKKLVKKVVTDKFVNGLIEKIKAYKKITSEDKDIQNFKLQNYMKNMTLEKARMKFSIECQMVPYVKFNFMSEKAYEKTSWACDFCLENGNYRPDSMIHILECDEYSKFRNDLNLHKDEDHVEYFSWIVKFRHSMINLP